MALWNKYPHNEYTTQNIEIGEFLIIKFTHGNESEYHLSYRGAFHILKEEEISKMIEFFNE